MIVKKKNQFRIAIIAVIFFIGFSWYSKASLERAVLIPYAKEGTAQNFSVQAGQNIKIVSANLEKAGLIKSASTLSRYAKKIKADTKIKVGEYSFSPSMTPKSILSALVAGDREEVWITIPEGWRIDQIASYLEKEGLVKARDFENIAKVKNFSDYPFLYGLSGNATLEGYLFPDTYRIFADADISDIIKVMLDNFGNKVTTDMIDKAGRIGLTLHEFVTLASIVDKESAHSADTDKIASVYYNRLNQKMPLQSDATITYITRRPDARPTFDETREKSPYNTYLNSGLPPGPVGNPGLAALSATLNPAETNYLFFVSRDGRAYFATTYEEHLLNINKYLGG
ncbi:endolytic transglycosylase MltG [Candidatus Microgenomates bacterium]|nr:endolytic transglycosylase MltG [Candidatus Microgenomates bacterium]